MTRLLLAAVLLFTSLPSAYPQSAGMQPAPEGSVKSVVMRCRECGIVNSIREVQQSREGATPGLGPDSPVGLVLYIATGPGSKRGDGFAGSVGNREWQNRISTTRYEYTVRMDDGDFRVVGRDGVSDLHVGDRVRVDGGRIERFAL